MMARRQVWMRVGAVLGLLSLMGSVSWAIDDHTLFEDPELQTRYDRLTEELRCVKCQNQTIGDSNAGIAKDLRLKVREMLLAGRSDEEILEYMVDRYGQFVLYRPPFNASTALLWLAPFLLLGAGAAVVAGTVRRRVAVGDDLMALEPDDEPPVVGGDHEADRDT
ncbi:MAG: cytochrome c-type biogenesis protein [Pseudomonadota bacterium]